MKIGEQVGRPDLALRVTSGGDVEEGGMLGAVRDLAHGKLSLEAFLADYGFYGPNPGEVSVPSWRVDPGPIEDMATGYKSGGTDPRDRLRRQAEDQAEAEAELLGLLTGRKRRSASIAIRLARKWVPYREVAKAAFLKAIDGARAAAKVLGDDLTRRGVLEDPSHICYFTVDEIVAGLGADAAATVEERRANEARYRTMQLPANWRGDPEPVVDEDEEPSSDGIGGIPASGGVTEGRARVVLDPGHCHEPIDVDEILVTRTTDPSWAAMFMSAAGLVVDIGTPLSHAAIIARELGIPCVIGTKNGTKVIPDGATIRVDGSAEEVELVAEGRRPQAVGPVSAGAQPIVSPLATRMSVVSSASSAAFSTVSPGKPKSAADNARSPSSSAPGRPA